MDDLSPLDDLGDPFDSGLTELQRREQDRRQALDRAQAAERAEKKLKHELRRRIGQARWAIHLHAENDAEPPHIAVHCASCDAFLISIVQARELYDKLAAVLNT